MTTMVTSLLSSIFLGSKSSQQSLRARMESMKAAESMLIQFASTRFHDLHDTITPTTPDNTDNNNVESTSTHHTMKVFNTKIPCTKIPLKDGVYCQVLNKDWCNGSRKDFPSSFGDDNDKDTFTIHGVEVTSHHYTNRIQESKLDGDTITKNEPPLVLLHGYMNGALYFYRNLLGLSNYCFGGKVYALDMLGWGLSSRPHFKTKKLIGDNSEHHDDTYATEQVFVESLEEWRKAHNIDKMTLGGHSMGGYLSVAYCEKYPERVDRLLLISPAGVPDDSNVDINSRLKNSSMTFRLMVGIVTRLWNTGMTPSSVLRNLPEHKGQEMVENYVKRRLPAISCPEERSNLVKYLYTNAALPGSGENCLNKILKPTTFAYKPTCHRIPFLKVKNVSFIYGQDDWMDPTGGIDTMKLCDKLRTEGNDDVPEVSMYGVRNSGHLLMLENWKEFNSAIIMSAGHGNQLPSHVPKPYHLGRSYSTTFFTKSRWQRKNNADDTAGSAAPA